MITNAVHLALLGDSIFDNGVYVSRGQSVVDHVKRLLPPEMSVSLVAVDGDVVEDVFGQIERLPHDVTHIALSVGGNDALGAIPATLMPARSVEDGLRQLAPIRVGFHSEYRRLMKQLDSLGKPVVVCTIYEHVPGLAAAHKTALALFNDAITREALAVDASVIDLRELCTEVSDYSSQSPIEPSETGGDKIAAAIVEWLMSRHQ